jgi:hypothetical protein
LNLAPENQRNVRPAEVIAEAGHGKNDGPEKDQPDYSAKYQ